MPKLCFKTRPAGNTVQLVRHSYCAQRGRSRTITVGTLSMRADPADYAADLSLHPGITLNASDHLAISNWLTQYGDPEAARYRADQVARIKAMLEQALSVNASVTMGPFEQAQVALRTLAQVLPSMAEAIVERGELPWTILRPTYLELSVVWGHLMKAAQTAGIAKQYKRGPLLTPDEVEIGITPTQEFPTVDYPGFEETP